MLRGYLAINDGLEYSNLSLSTQRQIYNFDGTETGKNYYLLHSETIVIGMIFVEKINNSFCSYFTTEATEKLSELYVKGENFALGAENGNLVIVTENNETMAHAVVIFEYAVIGSNGYYTIMDPSFDSYVTVSLNYDSLNNTSYFPYSPANSSGRYTSWLLTYY